MKHIILSISIVLSLMMALSSCHRTTPQEKAESLASEYIKNSLYFPDSYKVVQCKVDSAFGPRDTPETYSMLVEAANLFEQLKVAERTVKFKEQTYELYKSLGTRSSYNVYQIREAKEEFEKAQTKYNKLMEKISSLNEKVIEMENLPRKHTGWKVMQRYNAQTNEGKTISDFQLVFVDKDVTKVLASFEEEDLEKIVSFADEFQEMMQYVE